MPPLLKVLVSIAAAFGGASPAAAIGGALWFRLVAEGGAQIGHASHEIVPRPGGEEVVETFAIGLRSPGRRPIRVESRTVLSRNSEGRTVRIVNLTRTGREWTRTEADIEPGIARIERSTAQDRRSLLVPLPQEVRFDDGEALLRDWDFAARPRLAFDNFNLSALTVEQVVIERAPGPASDPPGSIALLRKRYEQGQLRSVVRVVLDEQRRVISSSQRTFGVGITAVPASREAALTRHPPFNALRHALVRSPFRISASAMRGHIRYRFTFADGMSFELPQTGEQRARADETGVTLDICDDCGPGLPADEASRAAALRPTAWLQSDHPRIMSIAAPIASQSGTEAHRMALLVARVRALMPEVDFAGHFSALETLSRRAGDCTEAAVLLASLARAAGIPTLVASGLVYSREHYHGMSNAFMPHSWVIAYTDGRWRSFDAALNGFDTTHIALTIGDGDARSVAAGSNLASLLLWRTMAEIRRRR